MCVLVTFVTISELIRSSVRAMMYSFDQTIVARKVKARKCVAQIAGNVPEA